MNRVNSVYGLFRLELARSLAYIVVTVFLFFATNSSYALSNKWDLGDYDDISPSVLLGIILDSKIISEKALLASYLAAKFPNTPEGLYSRTRIAYFDGNLELAKKLNRECLERYSDNLPCIYWAHYEKDVKWKYISKGLSLDPTFYDFVFIWNGYFYLLADKKSAVDANQFLDKWEREYPGAYIFDKVRGIYEHSVSKNYDKAEQYYMSAIESYDGDFLVFQKLARVRVKHLTDKYPKSRSQILYDTILPYLQNPNHADEPYPYIYLAEQLEELSSANRDSFDLYKKSIEIKPTSEALLGLTNSYYASLYRKEIDSIVKKTLKQYPNNSGMAVAAANFYAVTMGGGERAATLSKKAINSAYTNKEELTAVRDYANIMDFLGRSDKSVNVLSHYLDKYPSNADLRIDLFASNFYQGKFLKANEALNKSNELKTNNSNWYVTQRNNLDRHLANLESKEQYYRNNPFLRYWQRTVGESLNISIEFPVGSSAIPPKYYADLDKVAKSLKQPGADKYLFKIIGHTDSTGSYQTNEELSLRRAEAVVSFLKNRHGIPRQRLKAEGYGERFAISNNNTLSGRKANRRVEVIPAGKLSKPEILATAELNPRHELAMSPDGFTIAVGHSPIELWDTRVNARIGILGRGGNYAFSPNGRYLASRSSYTEVGDIESSELNIFDVKSRQVVMQLPMRDKVVSMAWSPFGNEIAYLNNTGRLFVYDIKEKRIANSTQASEITIPGKLLWTKDGKRIITAMAKGKVVRVWNADTLKLERELDGVDWVHAITQTFDSKFILVSDNRNVLSVWDTDSWTLRQVNMQFGSKEIFAHPNKQQVVLNSWNMSDGVSALLDVESLEVLNQVEAVNHTAFAFNGDGTKVYKTDKANSNIQILDSMSFDVVGEVRGQGVVNRFLESDQDNDYLLSFEEESTSVWDVTTGKKVHTWPHKFDTFRKSAEGEYFTFIDDWLVSVDTRTFELNKIKQFDEGRQKYAISGNYLAIATREEFEIGDLAPDSGVVHVYDRRDYSKIYQIPVDFVTRELRYGEIYGSNFSGFAIDNIEGLMAISTQWQDGYGREDSESKEINIYSIHNGDLITKIPVNKGVHGLEFKNGELLVETDKIRHYDLASEEFTKTSELRAFENLAFDNDRWRVIESGKSVVLLYDKLENKNSTIHFKDNLKDVAVFPKQNLIIALLDSGEMVFYDLNSHNKQLTIIPKKMNEWFAFTPSGEWEASLNGSEQVYWSFGDYILPFDSLKRQFHNPKVISEKLTAIAKGSISAIEKINEALEFDPTSLDMPFKLNILSELSVSTKEPIYLLQLEIQKLRKTSEKPELELMLNGRVLPAQRGLVKKRLNTSCIENCSDHLEHKIPLENGRNIIQVSIVHKGARLSQQTVVVNKKERTTASIVNNQNHLWFFGIGVSDYGNSEFNLDYADDDAQAIADALEQQEGKLFSKVHSKVLVNSEVTEKNIKIQMNRFLKKASSQDTIVIFLAGHGVQDNDQTLYFMTHDSQLDEPYTGMEVASFHNFLLKRPTSQKAIFWMDICHAGSLGDEWGKRRGVRITSEDAIKLVAEGTGISVMASSTGRESSIEGEQFGGGHGAFTHGLLKGLSGMADSEAGNQDGYINVSELQSFVSRYVPEITGGQQHPTVPSVRKFRDYPISTVH